MFLRRFAVIVLIVWQLLAVVGPVSVGGIGSYSFVRVGLVVGARTFSGGCYGGGYYGF